VLNIGWFSTGRDKAARQLLQAVQDSINTGHINGKISFVFSNREAGQTKESDLFFELVRTYNTPLICLSHKKFKTAGKEQERRTKYDREVSNKIASFACDLCVLAGYMLIVSQVLCQQHDMINLHPAPPGGPVGSWQDVIWALIDTEADTAGAMMHLVTPELDKGPVVTYCLFSIKGEPFAEYWRKDDRNTLFRLIRHHELAREFPLITLTLQSLGRGEVSIKNRRVIDAQGKSISGYNLSNMVDEEAKKILR
jgi:folate-dependent phosphoribosylglycinamide formyltransferase PurN